MVVQSGQTTVLVDCGFTVKHTTARLAELSIAPSQLDALLVTHEHGDHIKGVGPLSRKFDIPVFMTPGTHRSKDIGVIRQMHYIEGYLPFTIGSLFVTPVAVPHDAREPAQFVFESGLKGEKKRLGVLTDLGSVSQHVIDAYHGCHGLVLEANHDPKMLAMGPYPPSLKRRVAGLWGHLSNQQAADFFQSIDISYLETLVLAHISQKNNDLKRVCEAFEPIEHAVPNMLLASQEEGFDWVELKGQQRTMGEEEKSINPLLDVACEAVPLLSA
nr:MBL fold metallo-hydrolase [Marinibactrum halimedae]